MAAHANDALVGRSLGEFVLRERIGEGGFGAVYRASQPALDREAVIKVLHARLHSSQAATERFLREAKLASKLDHPYAAHIYAFGADRDGGLWIAMELVRGTPLDQVLKLQGPLSLERFVPLLERICEVVHTAHEQGIVHRDLKPANVMVLARAGRMLPKLLDFGIAKGIAAPTLGGDSGPRAHRSTLPEEPVLSAADTIDAGGAVSSDTQPMHLTQRNAVMGSPPYMAPEQWLDAGMADARTDLYALGILAYECLTGKPPFTGTTITAIARAHASDPPPPLGGRFPAALDRVFAKVLAKDGKDRYPDALAFAAAFRQASGLQAEAMQLPALEAARRDHVLANAPQPIAEAISGLDAARNAHEARDAIAQLAHTFARYVGLLAMACRSRVAGIDEPPRVVEALRTLYRRTPTDSEWLALARAITQPWLARRDAFPIPELVDVMQDAAVIEDLEALAATSSATIASDDALRELLDRSIIRVTRVLDAFGFLADYPLVVTRARGVAERWMGVRRAQRTVMAIRDKGLTTGVPALLDSDGAPVLSLAPLFQVAAPSPGTPPELFLFEGRDPRGARLVALPSGFERHDEAVWDWFRAQLSGSVDEASAAVSEEKPPYRGLSAFSVEDGASFFGREKLVDAFVNRLKVQPLLAVVGRSGAGKSSFVYAGVAPALSSRVISLRPGPAPLAALVARLEYLRFEAASSPRDEVGARLSTPPPVGDLRDAIVRDRNALGALLRAFAAERGPVLLVIDQLEELFTLCQDADERRVFAEAIATAARAPEDPVRVVFTLRDDFLVRTEQIPALRNRIGQGLQLLTVPLADDLERILVEPARRAGYELEGDLATEMVREVADQAGALALISFTASKLWELRDRHFKQLTRAAYRSLGGVGGALAHHADTTLDDMRPEERALAREAFRHLVTTQNSRAVLLRRDLRQLLGGGEHADSVIEKLVAARLLVASENEAGAETIEIIHEALLVTWPRLVEWRREDVDGARFREQLRAAATQWQDRGRAKGLLWRGDALADLARWRARHPGPVTDVEAAFAAATLAEGARARRNRRLLLVSAFASLVAIVVGLVVFNARVAGQRQRAETFASELHDTLQQQYENQGRRLLIAGDPLQALAYLEKARENGAGGPAHDFVVAEAIRATDGALLEVRHRGPVHSAQFSHDGRKLLTAGYDHEARVWDAQTGAQLLALPHAGPVWRARIAPDDATILTGGVEGGATLWDARSGARLHEFSHPGVVWCTAYSPDGTLVATAGEDDELEVADVRTGERRFRVHGDGSGFKACAFSHDGASIAAGTLGGHTRIWNTRNGELRRELVGRGSVNSVAFSPDDGRVLAAASSGALEWDLSTGALLQTLVHVAPVAYAEFSPDGRSIATASFDMTAGVWDAATGRRTLSLIGHASSVLAARFTPDGQYIVTTSGDASARLWDARDGRVVARWHGHRDAISDLPELDPEGKRVVTASDDGSTVVWKLAPQEHVRWLARVGRRIFDGQFAPDSKQVVVAGAEGAKVFDVATGSVVRELEHEPAVFASYSRNGALIATGESDGRVRLWDAASGAERASFAGRGAAVSAFAWSPDSALVVVGTDDGYLRAWNVRDRRLAFERHVGASFYGVSFLPDGKQLLTTGDDYMVRTWTVDGVELSSRHDDDLPNSLEVDPTGTRVVAAAAGQRAKIWSVGNHTTEVWLDGHVGTVLDCTWSRDGRFAITASSDGTARVWDGVGGAMLETITHAGPVIGARFSPDGKRVIVIDERGGVALHELPAIESPDELARTLRCLPFVWHADHFEFHPRDRSRCDQ